MTHKRILAVVAMAVSIPFFACSNLLLEAESADERFVTEDTLELTLTPASGDDASAITQDIELPTSNDEGTTISWSSSNPEVMTAEGIVTRPAFDMGSVEVTLTATLTNGTAVSTKTFTYTILPLAATDAQAVAAAKAAIAIGYATGDSADSVRQNLTLPTAGSNDTVVTWTSNNPAISDAGTVSRPAYVSGTDTTVTLTASITKAGIADTTTFTVTVIRLPQTDTEAVADGKANPGLAITYGGSDTASSVTVNLVSLPATSTSGTTVTWASSNGAYLTAAGIMTRPSLAIGDATITLTATITKGSVSDTKTFTLTVKAAGTAGITISLPVSPTASDLVFKNAGGTTITSFTVTRGTPVTVNTLFVGTSYAWYMDNGTVAVSTGSTCTLDGTLYALGSHTLLIDVLSGGKYYSGRIDFITTLP